MVGVQSRNLLLLLEKHHLLHLEKCAGRLDSKHTEQKQILLLSHAKCGPLSTATQALSNSAVSWGLWRFTRSTLSPGLNDSLLSTSLNINGSQPQKSKLVLRNRVPGKQIRNRNSQFEILDVLRPKMTTRGQQRHWLEEACSRSEGNPRRAGLKEHSPEPALGWFFWPCKGSLEVVESSANTEISELKWVRSAYPQP